MALNYNNLLGISIASGNKITGWPYAVNIVTLGIFERNGNISSSLIPPDDITYVSADPSIAYIDSNGRIIPVSDGTTTIHLSVTDNTVMDALIYCEIQSGVPVGNSMGSLGLTYA